MKKLLLVLCCFSFFIAFAIEKEKEPYVILAIDGGGIRGIIPATVLTLLEQEINCPIAKVCDCMGGTSTGGILTVGLAQVDQQNSALAKYKAQDLLDIYLTKYNQIFYRPFLYKLTSLWGFVAPKYSNEGLKKILENELEKAPLDNLLCNVVVPTYDLKTNSGFYFTYFQGQKNLSSFTSADVILATTAAPTYFPSVPVKDLFVPELTRNLIDGGIVANNPAELILFECLKTISLQEKEIYILSLGTGMPPEIPFTYLQSKDWGLFEYLNPLITSFLDTSSSLVESNLAALQKLNLINFIRINIDLPQEAEKMDNISKKNLALLQEKGRECYYQFIQSEEGQKILKLFKQRALNSVIN